MAAFKDRFNILFEESGLNQEEFGRLFSITKDQVFNWRNGRGEPDTETLKEIADKSKVSILWLVGKADNPTPSSSKDKPYSYDWLLNQYDEEGQKKLLDYIEFLDAKHKKDPKGGQ